MKTDPIRWNQDIISIFSDSYYGSFLTKANLQEEIVIEDSIFWLLNRNRKKYLLEHDKEKFLPIIPSEYFKVTHRNKLYHHIKKFKSAKFKSEKNWDFREFVDGFMNVAHSNPRDFLIYKLLVLTAYFERINARIATEASFGKGTPLNALGHLRKDVSVINPRSMAAVEYRLTNKLICLDEVSNLESSQRKLLQEFLLLVGDFKNVYEKSTRGSGKYGTHDSYNIKNLSLLITYNTLDHYAEHGQKDLYFDKVFQKAAMDRYLPLKLEGIIDVKQFILMQNKEKLAKDFKGYYIDFIRTVEYFKQNYIEELEERGIIKNKKFVWSAPLVGGLLTGRQQLTYDRLTRFIALYSKDETEFKGLCHDVLRAVRNYYIMLNKGNTILTSEIEGEDGPLRKQTEPVVAEKIEDEPEPAITEEFVLDDLDTLDIKDDYACKKCQVVQDVKKEGKDYICNKCGELVMKL